MHTTTADVLATLLAIGSIGMILYGFLRVLRSFAKPPPEPKEPENPFGLTTVLYEPETAVWTGYSKTWHDGGVVTSTDELRLFLEENIHDNSHIPAGPQVSEQDGSTPTA
jgi:hypothetical protein